jgi:hypothetical protein
MSSNKIKKIVLQSCFLLMTTCLSVDCAMAQEESAEGGNQIAKWLTRLSLPSSELPEGSAVAAKIIVIGHISKSGDVTTYPMNPLKFSELSYLSLVDKQAFSLNRSLNQRPWLGKLVAPENANEALIRALNTADASVAIVAPKLGVGKWQAIAFKKEKRQNLFSTNFEQAPDEDTLIKWFFKNAGYDGTILAKQTKYLLLGSQKNKVSKQAKAFIIRDSADKFSLKGLETEKLPARIVKVFENYAVLEFNDPNPDQPFELVGSKVILEN